jgi:hypothetical protein
MEVSCTNCFLGLDCLPRNLRRRVGPERAGELGFGAEVEVTDAESRPCQRTANNASNRRLMSVAKDRAVWRHARSRNRSNW